ncbi:hypothetical protein [Longispora albida]|uniref:hypothetical protein n=1 Tax=Longispora albida TaxID=203523 RepID=UPI0003691254|nr:hypothetical protein [Longispora albida]
MPDEAMHATIDALRAWLADPGRCSVSLVGPVGSGKTTLLAGLFPDLPRLPASLPLPPAGGQLLIIDGVDTPALAQALSEQLTPDRLVLAAGRFPATPASVIAMRPEPGAHQPLLEPVARLAQGNPLLTSVLCGENSGILGAMADRAATVLSARLGTEWPGDPASLPRTLRLLAAVGECDAELLASLTSEPELFSAVRDLSVTTATELGVTLAEPFRAVFDESFRWREPLAYRTALTRAAAYRRTLIDVTPDLGQRAILVSNAVYLTGDRVIRDSLFTRDGAEPLIRPAGPADFDAIGRLVRRWAERGGLDPRTAERLLDTWLRTAPPGSFRLACDPEGRPVGVASAIPITGRTIGSLEPVLQQYTTQLGAGAESGVFVGLGYCEERYPALHSALLRGILRSAIQGAEAVVVSTPWPGYQQLVEHLGFTRHGGTADDVYRCGRPPEVYSHSFAPAGLTTWLEDLSSRGIRLPVTDSVSRTAASVRQALERLHDPPALASSPLLALAGTGGVAALHAMLVDAVTTLALSPDRIDAEAGQTLMICYVEGDNRRRERIAEALHHSRATHFRRIQRGLTAIATRFLTLEPQREGSPGRTQETLNSHHSTDGG